MKNYQRKKKILSEVKRMDRKISGYSICCSFLFFPLFQILNVVGLPLTETIGLLNGLGFKSPSFLHRSTN